MVKYIMESLIERNIPLHVTVFSVLSLTPPPPLHWARACWKEAALAASSYVPSSSDPVGS